MATFTATAAQTNASGFFLNPPRYIENGVVSRSAGFTFVASASPGDVIQMIPIPRGAQVIDTILAVTGGMAATSNVAFNVGDGNATGRYVTSGSAAAAVGSGVIIRSNNGTGVGYSYSVDDTIDVIVGTLGSMSAQLAMRLTVTYQFDNATDGNG